MFLERLWWYLYRDAPVTAAAGTAEAARPPGRPAHGGTGPAAAVMTAARNDLVRTTAGTAGVFDRLIISAGAEGTVLETRPDGSCLAELVRLPPTGEEDIDEYRRDMLAEGYFPQVVLKEGEYEVIRVHGLG